MSITLQQFEQIDALMARILRMGPFETCEHPRAYVATENVLFDKLVDALGLDYVNDYASTLECAAAVVTAGLLGTIAVVDEEEA